MVQETPTVDLGDLVEQVRKNVGYCVHPETGLASYVVQAGQFLIGLVTKKTSLSPYQENVILVRVAQSSGGTSLGNTLSWERTRGRYHGIIVENALAEPIREGLEESMRSHLEKTRL